MSFKHLPPDRRALYVPFLASLDAGHALDRLEGDERLYMSLLEYSLSDGSTAPQRIALALAKNQTPEAIALAHSLSGSAGNLGLLDVHHDAQRLVVALRQRAPTSEILLSLQRSLNEAKTAITILRAQILPTLPTPPPLHPTPLSPGKEQISALRQALQDRDFRSVELYAQCRSLLAEIYPDGIGALDLEMDLLNFKNAATLLATYQELSS